MRKSGYDEFARIDDCRIHAVIKNWLRGSGDRDGGRSKRRAQRAGCTRQLDECEDSQNHPEFDDSMVTTDEYNEDQQEYVEDDGTNDVDDDGMNDNADGTIDDSPVLQQ